MFEERVKLVEELIEAFNARDVDGFLRLTTEDFKWFTSVMAVEGEVFVGREGIETYFQRMRDAWDEFVGLLEVWNDLGDRILVSGHLEGRGRGSGVDSRSHRWTCCYEFRGDKISLMHSFLDHDEALRAAGSGGRRVAPAVASRAALGVASAYDRAAKLTRPPGDGGHCRGPEFRSASWPRNRTGV